LKKIFDSEADCVVLDCEDGVAENRKVEARKNINKLFYFDERIQNDPTCKYAVRINSIQSTLIQDDINAFFTLNAELLAQNNSKVNFSPINYLPKCLFVPKLEDVSEIVWLYEELEDKLNFFRNDGFKKLDIVLYMESALGLLNIKDVVKAALKLSREKYNNKFDLQGVVFGSDDYCADIGATRTKDATELLYARQKLVAICKAFHLQVIDMVYIDYKGFSSS
jgi:citrate lyase subunit beta-like protein